MSGYPLERAKTHYLPSTQEGRFLVVPATFPGRQEHFTVCDRSSIRFLLQHLWAAITSQVPPSTKTIKRWTLIIPNSRATVMYYNPQTGLEKMTGIIEGRCDIQLLKTSLPWSIAASENPGIEVLHSKQWKNASK